MKSLIKLFLDPKNRIILISNFLVLIGVFVFDYSVHSIFVLFWAETVVFGIFAFLKQILSRKDVVPISSDSEKRKTNSIPYRIFTASIWLSIYCVFMHVLGKFISHLFGPGWYGEAMGGFDLTIDLFIGIYKSDLIWGWIALLIPHLYSFTYNYIILKGRDTIPFMALTMGPWFRVAVLQIALIISGLIIMLFNEGVPALIILLLLKSIYDMGAQKISDSASRLQDRMRPN